MTYPLMREADNIDETLNVAQWVYKSVGPGIGFHNYLCAVCKERHAVWDMSRGVLEPCHQCEKIGWRLQRLGFLQRIMEKLK